MDSKQCIGPCYKRSEEIIHPITYQIVTDHTRNFCPVNPWKNKFTNRVESVGECAYGKVNNRNYKIDYLNQTIYFDENSFLKIYYQIFGLDLAILWYNDNPHISYNTIRRIMDCAIKVYGIAEFYDKDSSDMINEFTKFMILNYWYVFRHIKLEKYKRPSGEELILWFDFDYDIKMDSYTMKARNEINIDVDVYENIMFKMLYEKIEEILTEKLLIYIHRTLVETYRDKWDEIDSHFSKLKKIAQKIIQIKLLETV
jgi:hypothetical protein